MSFRPQNSLQMLKKNKKLCFKYCILEVERDSFFKYLSHAPWTPIIAFQQFSMPVLDILYNIKL